MAEYIKVEKIHSATGRDKRQEKVLLSLGLRKRHQVKILKKQDAVLGMVKTIPHLVKWEEVDSPDIKKEKVESYRVK